MIWETEKRETVATKFSIPNKISIQITAPNRKYDEFRFDKEIKNEEIHNYRMYVPNEEILSLSDNYNDIELKKAKKSQMSIYHPDKFNKYISKSEEGEILSHILNRRTQEIQYAYEELHKNLENEKARKEYRQR